MNKRLNLIGGNLTHSPLDTLVAVSRALPPRFPVQMADVQIDSQGLRVDRAGGFVLDCRSSQARARPKRLLRIDRSRARESRLRSEQS